MRPKSTRARKPPDRLDLHHNGVTKRSKIGRAKKPALRKRPHLARAALVVVNPGQFQVIRTATTAFLRGRRTVTRNLTDPVVAAYNRAPRGRANNAALRAVTKKKRGRLGLADHTRTQLAEMMGERGVLEYVRQTGNPHAQLRHADANAPYREALTPNARWGHAITFRGSGVADAMHWDGTHLQVLESKGGSSQLNVSPLTGRTQQYDLHTGRLHRDLGQTGPKLAQGSNEYIVDIAREMHDSGHPDGRSDAGRHIMEAFNNGTLRYFTVATDVPDPTRDLATTTILK